MSEIPREEDPGTVPETVDGPQAPVPWRPVTTSPAAIAYRAVLLAALLVVIAFFIRQLLTLGLLMVLTITIALALSAATTRLERIGIPRVVGASAVMLAVLGALVGAGILIARPLTSESDTLRQEIPDVLDRVGGEVQSITGTTPSHLLDQAQSLALDLLSPALVTSVLSVAAGIVLVLITALYIAIRPQPLVDGMVRLVPPDRRGWAMVTLERIRHAWLGWLLGTLVNMVAVGILLYIAFRLLGLDFAVLLAVLGSFGEFVPYFGPIIVSIPAVLIALADSIELAVVTALVILVIQQVEGNLLVPVVMARTVNLHPALVAVGVVAVSTALGPVALLVAVPVLSAIVILVEELWIRPREHVHETRPEVVAARRRGLRRRAA